MRLSEKERNPVTRVDLSNKRPWEGRRASTDRAPNLFGWWRAWQPSIDRVNEDDPDTLPHELMCLLNEDPRRVKPNHNGYNPHMQMGNVLFTTPEVAVDALSDACVRLGRERAGLVAPLAVAGGG